MLLLVFALGSSIVCFMIKKKRKQLEITFLGTLARRNFVAWVLLREDLYTLLQMPKNFQ